MKIEDIGHTDNNTKSFNKNSNEIILPRGRIQTISDFCELSECSWNFSSFELNSLNIATMFQHFSQCFWVLPFSILEITVPVLLVIPVIYTVFRCRPVYYELSFPGSNSYNTLPLVGHAGLEIVRMTQRSGSMCGRRRNGKMQFVSNENSIN